MKIKSALNIESMTDKEILEAAAKAAGIDAKFHSELGIADGLYLKGKRGPSNSKYWNPLTDDGDALRLAVKLRIEVSPCDGVVIANFPFGPNRELHEIHEMIGPDRYETTRRAIVRAAAEIGKV